MATYLYETVPQNPGDEPRQFEFVQKMTEATLTHDPKTGLPVKAGDHRRHRKHHARHEHPLDEQAAPRPVVSGRLGPRRCRASHQAAIARSASSKAECRPAFQRGAPDMHE